MRSASDPCAHLAAKAWRPPPPLRVTAPTRLFCGYATIRAFAAAHPLVECFMHRIAIVVCVLGLALTSAQAQQSNIQGTKKTGTTNAAGATGGAQCSNIFSRAACVKNGCKWHPGRGQCTRGKWR